MSVKAKSMLDSWSQAIGSGEAACLKPFVVLNILMCVRSKPHGEALHPRGLRDSQPPASHREQQDFLRLAEGWSFSEF